ncbi:MAG: MATE family efflux transporter [Lachnospiraceae bacterium]|jgi:Na+-driven multidrug efflux pump|nr:MATE family efflux transporter [Lachnospiraceae bacterium]MCI1656469.1 MATE family efflux transporter [Lachnospiraceae bacterium]MCI2194951.1 MATE family efflux transporter [Lachnospiraceae bacterium]
MREQTVKAMGNPLGTLPIAKLLPKFAIPAVISMIVSALYNIVDQIFIGWGVGVLGNAATNVAFPIPTICLSLALLAGIGGSANYNICSGKGEEEEGLKFAGNALSMMVILGVAMLAGILIFLRPLLFVFGATDQVMPYAVDYARIIAYGLPFYFLGFGATHLIRADRSPAFSMFCGIIGAVINLVLDPIFIFGFHWGMKGAALATILGQIVTAVIAVIYFAKLSSMKIRKQHLVPGGFFFRRIFVLGIGDAIFNLSIALSQIVMNNVIRAIGPSSVYGVEIPLACVGIIVKIDQVFRGIGIGVHQGCQPIFGFNYGAKKYDRVRECFRRASIAVIITGVIFFAAFMLFPKGILLMFGAESEAFFAFGVRFFRIYLMFTILNALPQLISGFFTAVGKPVPAAMIPVIKHIFTFIPLVLLLPMLLGMDGIMLAGAISDAIIIVVSLLMVRKALKKLTMAKTC